MLFRPTVPACQKQCPSIPKCPIQVHTHKNRYWLEKVSSFKSLYQPENTAFRNIQVTSQLGNGPTRLLRCKQPQHVASSFQRGGGRPRRFSADYFRLRFWMRGTATDFVRSVAAIRFHFTRH